MLARLVGGNILEIQKLYELPVKAIFNHLSYQLDGGIKTNNKN